MKSRRLVGLAAIGAALAQFAGSASAAEIWTARSGWTAVHFYTEAMRDLGMQLTQVNQTVLSPNTTAVQMEDPDFFFSIAPESDLRFKTFDGKLLSGELLDGSIRHLGGLSVATSGRGVYREFRDFAVGLETSNDQLGFSLSNGIALSKSAFEIAYPRYMFDASTAELVLGPMDLRINPEFAVAMGHPELADRTIGAIEMHVTATQTGATAERKISYTPNFASNGLDVSLGDLNDMSQVAREGTYPTGTMGGAMATTSCNLGTVDVPWHAAMEENHPTIAMALYREMNGKFEQVGVSDLKHGFFALSSSQCTPCQHPSDGTFLGVGCSDTYAVSNNSDRQWLAPRPEVQPFKGIWTCTGSHFAGGQNDCIRRHGSSGHTNAQHRLAVADTDLGNAGATYYYEGYYVVQNDGSKHNNIGSRRCTMTLSGNTWNFNTPNSGNPLTEGPAIERWAADLRTNQVAPGGGQVILSAKVTDNGNGTWNYEYALFNFDSDRGVQSFSVPVGTDVTNIGFHDPDVNPANDWTVTVADGAITWQCETYDVNPAAHYLIFGTLYNFRFTTNIGPTDGSATLKPFTPGIGGTSYAAATRIPSPNPAAIGDAPASRLVQLDQNRPNPLSPTTTIHFVLASASEVQLDVFDTSGRHIQTLSSGAMSAGAHDVVWDGKGADGRRVSSGQYYYRLQAGSFVGVRSMLILK